MKSNDAAYRYHGEGTRPGSPAGLEGHSRRHGRVSGYTNRSLPDADLDSFVDAIATRIASVDKRAIADTSGRWTRRIYFRRGNRCRLGCPHELDQAASGAGKHQSAIRARLSRARRCARPLGNLRRTTRTLSRPQARRSARAREACGRSRRSRPRLRSSWSRADDISGMGGANLSHAKATL